MAEQRSAKDRDFAHHLLVTLAIVIIISLLLYFGVAYVLLLVFGGLLVGTALRLLASGLVRIFHLPHGAALLGVILLLLGLMTAGSWAAAPRLSRQFDQLTDQLPIALAQFKEHLSYSTLGRFLLQRVPLWTSGGAHPEALGQITGVLSSTVGTVVNVVVVLFVGLYSAYEPGVYIQGLLALFPAQSQPRLRQVISVVDYTLKWWIGGQWITMIIVGVLAGTGLWLCGIPLALVLGVIAGMLSFVPIFGSLLSFVPAGLIAVAQSPQKLLYVIGIWLVAHTLEGYVLTPVVQRRTVRLPPVIGICSQITLAALLGPVGLVFAYPLAAVVIVVIKMLYVEDALGNKISVPGENPSSVP